MSGPAIVLLAHLEAARACWEPRAGSKLEQLYYRGPSDFILREGTAMPFRPLPAGEPTGLPRKCFHNAIMYGAVNRRPYVEGYAVNSGGMVVHHAWNLDERGRVVDITWDERRMPNLSTGFRAYMGVQFSVWRAHECSWYGDATVIDDLNRGWPLLAQRWEGEDSPGDETMIERTLRDIHLLYNAEGAARADVPWDVYLQRLASTFEAA